MRKQNNNWSLSTHDITSKANMCGFGTVTELLDAMPNRPYCEIANILGNVAPIQVIAVQFNGITGTELRKAAMDCLCRNIVEKLPDGWGVGENAEWRSVQALTGWSSEIQVTGGHKELKPTLSAIAQRIRQLPPPTGWIPRGVDDRIISDAFEVEWPKHGRKFD